MTVTGLSHKIPDSPGFLTDASGRQQDNRERDADVPAGTL